MGACWLEIMQFSHPPSSGPPPPSSYALLVPTTADLLLLGTAAGGCVRLFSIDYSILRGYCPSGVDPTEAVGGGFSEGRSRLLLLGGTHVLLVCAAGLALSVVVIRVLDFCASLWCTLFLVLVLFRGFSVALSRLRRYLRHRRGPWGSIVKLKLKNETYL